jgi:hypothetical protein
VAKENTITDFNEDKGDKATGNCEGIEKVIKRTSNYLQLLFE